MIITKVQFSRTTQKTFQEHEKILEELRTYNKNFKKKQADYLIEKDLRFPPICLNFRKLESTVEG
jgi:hypothetical protein